MLGNKLYDSVVFFCFIFLVLFRNVSQCQYNKIQVQLMWFYKKYHKMTPVIYVEEEIVILHQPN